MNVIEQLAIETALANMVKNGRFSICTIREILQLTSTVCGDQQALKTLELLHCVNFADMPPELLHALPSLIQKVLGGTTLNITAMVLRSTRPEPGKIIDIAPLPAKRGFFGLLK